MPHREITLDCSRTNTTCLAVGCVLCPGAPLAPDVGNVPGGTCQVGTLPSDVPNPNSLAAFPIFGVNAFLGLFQWNRLLSI